jgi:DNA-binding transcriptional LysR family regulator
MLFFVNKRDFINNFDFNNIRGRREIKNLPGLITTWLSIDRMIHTCYRLAVDDFFTGVLCMNEQQLECFVMVAEYQNFSKAANKLYLTQPAITGHIKRLENSMGHRLFERSTRSVRLTAEGDLFLPAAKEILRILQDAQLSINQLYNKHALHLAVGHYDFAGDSIFHSFMKTFLYEHLEWEVTMTEEIPTVLLNMLSEDKLDVAFSLEYKDFNWQTFSCVTLEEIENVIIVPQDNPLAKNQTLSLSDIDNQTVIIPPLTYMSDILRKWHVDNILNNPNCKVVMLSRDIARIWLEANKGICINPPVSYPTVKQFHFDNSFTTRRCLVWNKQKVRNNKLLKEFVEAVEYFYRNSSSMT